MPVQRWVLLQNIDDFGHPGGKADLHCRIVFENECVALSAGEEAFHALEMAQRARHFPAQELAAQEVDGALFLVLRERTR